MSYSRLVFDRDDTQAAAEQFLDQVVLFDVHRRPAEGRDRRRLVGELAVGGALDEARVAGLLDELSDPVHRPGERTILPVIRVRGPVSDRRQAVRVDQVAIGRRTLRTQGALVDGRVGVAFDVDAALVLHVDQLAAADGTVGTDRGHDRVGVAGARFLLDRFTRHWLRRHSEPADRPEPARSLLLDRHPRLLDADWTFDPSIWTPSVAMPTRNVG